MSYIMKNKKNYSSLNAKNISFDNSNTELTSNNVEDVVKELNNKFESKISTNNISGIMFGYINGYGGYIHVFTTDGHSYRIKVDEYL